MPRPVLCALVSPWLHLSGPRVRAGSGDYNAGIPALLLLALVTTASPAHRALFAPPARASLYSFATTDERIDRVAAYYQERWPSDDPRPWKVETSGPVDVFDGAALFDRARLARLYGGKVVRIARGPIVENGRVTHTVLLLSPYPDAELTRLNQGTLIMTVLVP